MVLAGNTNCRATPLSVRLQLPMFTDVPLRLCNSTQSGNAVSFTTLPALSAAISLSTTSLNAGATGGKPGVPFTAELARQLEGAFGSPRESIISSE
jgi:hypothetical protein